MGGDGMMGDDSPLLEIRDLKTQFKTRRGMVPAVDEVSLTVERGEIVGIVGESGCGKSVTSLSVMRLVTSPGRIVGGSVRFEGVDLLRLDEKRMRAVRGKEISMIFQEPMTSLNPVYKVGKQVAESLRSHVAGIGTAAARTAVAEIFARVGIPEPGQRLDAYPHQLSGGLRQRVMIAMALICKPKLLIADEPTTALDVTIEAQILALMKGLQRDTGASIALISHNLGVIAETCDRVYVMYAGRVMEEAGVFELFDFPAHPYTRGLLKSIPRITGDEGTKKALYSIRGNVPDMQDLPRGCRFAPRCDMGADICLQKEPGLVEAGKGHFARCWFAGSGQSQDQGAAKEGGS
jgi:peptide/nickel transport system ATP-binding protein/oligopeptide transport system ATP-binding protein